MHWSLSEPMTSAVCAADDSSPKDHEESEMLEIELDTQLGMYFAVL